MENRGLLTRTETAALRGVAILGIILHNYCHFLGFAVKENEYKFDAGRPMQFFEKLLSLDKDLFIHIFSFFGHYGVPVFLFISGYGLVKKYESSPQRTSPLPFTAYHFLKLFRLMIIGYLVFIGVYLLRHNDGAQVYSWDRVLTQLTMTINFMYFDPDHIIKPGPYWYFGLTLQLYILYVLVIHRWRNSKVLAVLAIGSLLAEALCVNAPDWLNSIRYNFVGGLLPFCLGVWISRNEHLAACSRTGYLAVAVVSALAVLFGSMTFWSWLIVPLLIVTGAVATVRLLSPQSGEGSKNSLLGVLAWVGGISSALFVMHPVMREIIIGHYRKIDIYGGIAVYLLASVALAMLLQWVLQFVPSPKLKKRNG